MSCRILVWLFLLLIGSVSGVVPVYSQVAVSIPNVEGSVGGTGVIPVSVGDLTGRGATSYEFTVTFDPAVVTLTGASVNGTLSEGTNATINASQPGRLIIAWAAANPLSGGGTLINLEASFQGTGTSAISFTSFLFNEGSPTSATSSGSVTVTEGGGGGPLSLSIPQNNTATQGAGDVLIPVSIGNADGFNITSFSLTLSFDASTVNLIDAEGAGTKTASGTLSVDTGTTGRLVVNWSGGALSGAGTLVNIRARPVSAGQSTINFVDASFNSGNPAAATSNGSITIEEAGVTDVAVSIPTNLNGFVGDLVNVPINVDDVTGKDITTYSFTLTYNASLLLPRLVQNENTLSAGATARGVISAPGRYTVTWTGSGPLSGAGTLIKVQYELLNVGSTPIGYESFQFNNGTPGTNLSPGNMTLEEAQTTDPVNVSLADRTGPLGQTVVIPVSVDNLDGKGVSQFETTLSFNSSIVNILNVRDAGSLIQGTAPTLTTASPGEATITWSGETLSGAGTLFYLEVGLLSVGSTALSFASFTFNDGSPEARLGSATISVSESTNPPTVGVSLPGTITGNVGETLTVPLNIGLVTDLGINRYTFTLLYDAAVLSFTTGSVQNTLSSNGTLNVNTNTAGQVVVTWTGASDLSSSGILVNLEASLLTQGSSALTLSSFTFNDGDPVASTINGSVSVSPSGTSDPVVVALPTGLTGEVDNEINIPVSVGSLTGRSVNRYAFTITYNEADIELIGVNIQGTLSAGESVSLTTPEPGRAVVTMTQGQTLSGSGTLVTLVANAIGPGSSILNFENFTFNGGAVGAAAVSGSVKINGVATYLQFVHNSPDAPIVDIYVNDVQVVNTLQYANATDFVEINSPLIKIDVVFDGASNNNAPILSQTVTLVSGQSYVAVLNGLFNSTGKNNLDVVVEPSIQRANNEDAVDIVLFNGSPDSPAMTVNLVEENNLTNRLQELLRGLDYGRAGSERNLPPEIYHFELADSTGRTLGVFKADLSRVSGSALLFMVQGFIEPGLGQPLLSVTAYAPDGTALFLPLVTSEEDELDAQTAFLHHGNYPEPFVHRTSIAFDLREPAQISVEVYDMLGRQVYHAENLDYAAGRQLTLDIEGHALASGTYVYRLLVTERSHTFMITDTMTLAR